MAQVTSVTSEALQATIRRLLPSQQGFGEDLQASNVVIPVIDLTSSAEGSSLGSELQTAATHTQAIEVIIANGTQNIVATAGFYKGTVTITNRSIGGTDTIGQIAINDGSSSKSIVSMKIDELANGTYVANTYTHVVFLQSGDTLQAISNSTECFVTGSYRQIADISGTLINPTGFTGE